MADVTVGAGEVSSGRFTLTADTVYEVAFADNVAGVEIISDGAAAAYYTVDGSDPTDDGTNTFELPAGGSSVDSRQLRDSTDVLKFISTGTPSIRVQRS